MSRTVTLAATLPHADLAPMRARFPAGLIARAVSHHVARRLRADVSKGSATDRAGFVSQFIAYDWPHAYDNNPAAVFADFFHGRIANSCSRMERGLTP